MKLSGHEKSLADAGQAIHAVDAMIGRAGRAMDLLAQRFGRWTVIDRDSARNRSVYWLCRCDCGSQRVVRGNELRNGSSSSCGCLRNEMTGNRVRRHGCASKGGTPEYRSWHSMLTRCENQNEPGYPNYGGRGIKVCPRWHSFESFLADMGYRPSQRHTLDRVNNAGDYEPLNARWATWAEQSRNKRTNRTVTVGSATMPLVDAAALCGLNYHLIHNRLSRGWSLERALSDPPRVYRKVKR